MKSAVTERQRELLQLIYDHIRDNGYSPTLEEMREGLNVASNQSILDLLGRLEERRLIQKDSTARSLRITFDGFRALGESPLIANLGISSAGMPLEMVEISGEWEMAPSSDVAKFKDNIFLLKISGDSMIDAGIEDGDAVLVKSQKEFVSGDIVLARIGDGSTVKRFISNDKSPYVYLKPENLKYDVIPFTEETKLIGKVISVLKKGHWKAVR